MVRIVRHTRAAPPAPASGASVGPSELALSVTIPLLDEASSNRLLRALWAEIREEFGKLAWQYMPQRLGAQREVYFGYADLGLSRAVQIGISYRRKGIIERVLFKEFFDMAGLPAARFEACLRAAETAVVSFVCGKCHSAIGCIQCEW